MTGCSWASSKFEGRCADTAVLLRCSVRSQLADSVPQAELTRQIQQELERLLGATSAPILIHCFSHRRALPVLAVGHGQLIGEVLGLLDPSEGFFLGGSYIGGVGIGDCVQTGFETAGRLAGYLNR